MGVPVDLLSTFAQRRPRLLRDGLEILRRGADVRRFGNTVLVLGAESVRDVLGRPTDFLSGAVYAPKLKLGPLALAMESSPRQLSERAALEELLSPAKLVSFKANVEEQARAALQAKTPSMDFVTDYIEPVLTGAMCRLFGIDPSSAQSRLLRSRPGLLTFEQWIRKLGGALAAPMPAPFGLEAIAEGLAPELAGFLRGQLQASALGQLQVGALPGPESVVRCVGGVLLASAAIFRASTFALHELIGQGQLEAALQDCADAADPEPVVLGYLREALRLNPPFVALGRYCPRPTTIRSQSASQRNSMGGSKSSSMAVPAGAQVIVSLLSAMFDPTAVDNPDEFSLSRPASVYLPFGYGLHACVGKRFAEAGLALALVHWFSWLREHGLQVKAQGKIVYDGPAVARYRIEFVPRSSSSRKGAEPSHETGPVDDLGPDRSKAAE